MYEKKLEWLRPRALRPGMILYLCNQPVATVVTYPSRTSGNGQWFDAVGLDGNRSYEWDSEDWVLVEIPPTHGEVFWKNYMDVLDLRDSGELSEEDAQAEIDRLRSQY